MEIVGRKIRGVMRTTHWSLFISHYILSSVEGERVFILCASTPSKVLLSTTSATKLFAKVLLNFYFPQSSFVCISILPYDNNQLWQASFSPKQMTQKLAAHSPITRNLKEEASYDWLGRKQLVSWICYNTKLFFYILSLYNTSYFSKIKPSWADFQNENSKLNGYLPLLSKCKMWILWLDSSDIIWEY